MAALVVLAAGVWLMSRFLIAEGAITLAAFPLSIAIVGSVYFGATIAVAWAVTIFGAFVWFFGMSPSWAGAYAALYGIAAHCAAYSLRRLGFSDLFRAPVRSLLGWYLVVGVVAPVVTTLIGVPMLVAGGAVNPDANLMLLMVSNFISDSFSPISLGFALFVLIESAMSRNESTRRANAGGAAEKGLWLALASIAAISVTFFGEAWMQNGVDDATPAFYLLLAWAALRFDLTFAMVASAGAGLLVTSCVTFGLGGAAIPSTTQEALSVYANLLALTILAQITGAMTLQRSLDHDRAIAAELDRAQLKRYFSPRIVDELLTEAHSVDRTRRLDVAVMFIDIVGFTSIAESQTPEESIAMLREYDTAMEAQIFEHGGVVDKYLGDGVMAAFGLPQAGDADVTAAIECAREMLRHVAQLAARRQAEGKRPYRIGIGIHHGEVVAGNVGSERNLSFTVIGDTVNTASRLETLSRELDADIVVSDEIVACVRRELGQPEPEILRNFRRAGSYRVKGRNEPVGVWVLPRDRDTVA